MQKSLSFPGSSRTSSEEEARDLIKGLLLESKTRLTYKDILKHPYFSLIDWDHLLDGMCDYAHACTYITNMPCVHVLYMQYYLPTYQLSLDLMMCLISMSLNLKVKTTLDFLTCPVGQPDSQDGAFPSLASPSVDL